MNKMKKATLLFAVFLASVISLAWASPFLYEWWSTEIVVTEEGLSGTVEWSGTPVVGNTLTITVTITNPTATDVTGTLTVEIYDTSDLTSPIEQVFTGDITVLLGDIWSDSYTWTAILGNYKAKATFTG